MTDLKDILYKVAINAVVGTTIIRVNKVEFDSRKVNQDDVFVAIRGSISDGHDFIEKAINQGALAVICEKNPDVIVNGVTYIEVEDTQAALAIMASNYYDSPSGNLKLVGVTGTNGKTTVATLLFKLFKKAGFKVGLLSTVKILVDAEEYSATHTTPDSLTINYYLKEMNKVGVEYCFMEVSSHGIHQKRTEGLQFAGGIFTNLSHDHLDYHNTFSEYRDVKKAFFDGLGKHAFALTNVDDKNGNIMLQNTKATKKSYSQRTLADYKVKVLEKNFSGMLLQINHREIWVQLVGGFNASNLGAIYGVAKELGVEDLELLTALSQLKSVDGRFQYQVSKTGVVSVVDMHIPQMP